MSKKEPDEAAATGRPALSEEGRRAARTRSDRQAAALRENLLKRKRQQRARDKAPAPFPTDS